MNTELRQVATNGDEPERKEWNPLVSEHLVRAQRGEWLICPVCKSQYLGLMAVEAETATKFVTIDLWDSDVRIKRDDEPRRICADDEHPLLRVVFLCEDCGYESYLGVFLGDWVGLYLNTNHRA